APGDFSKLWSKLPRLETLILQGGSWTLGQLDLPALKSAEFRTGGLSRASIQSISTAKWANLERLHIWFGDENYGAECNVGDLEAILNGKGLPKLKSLGLMNAEFSDEIARAVSRAPILKQLETLDLSMGTMGDAGAATIAESTAFKHLKRINLDE